MVPSWAVSRRKRFQRRREPGETARGPFFFFLFKWRINAGVWRGVVFCVFFLGRGQCAGFWGDGLSLRESA